MKIKNRDNQNRDKEPVTRNKQKKKTQAAIHHEVVSQFETTKQINLSEKSLLFEFQHFEVKYLKKTSY